MPNNVFGNSNSYDNGNKIDTSLFVQKQQLRSKYIEASVEEDFDLKNQHKIKNLAFPISIHEAASKDYVDGAIFLGVNETMLLRLHPDSLSRHCELDYVDYVLLHSTVTSPRTTMEIPTKKYVHKKIFHSSIIKSTARIDLNDRNITNARFIQVNQLPQIDSHLRAKLYVDNSIDEPSLVRNNKDKDFGYYYLTIINSITLYTQAINDNLDITKADVEQFHLEKRRSPRDVGLYFYDESSDLLKNNQDNDFNDNKLTNIDSITVNRNTTSVNQLTNNNHIDDELDKITILRFNQTLENYLKVSVGSDTYKLIK